MTNTINTTTSSHAFPYKHLWYQHTSDLLHDNRLLGLQEQVKQHTAEVVRVVVGVAQLIGNRVQDVVAPFFVQARHKNLHRLRV